jgi:hypothetical protein
MKSARNPHAEGKAEQTHLPRAATAAAGPNETPAAAPTAPATVKRAAVRDALIGSIVIPASYPLTRPGSIAGRDTSDGYKLGGDRE